MPDQPILSPGRNCWRIEAATRATVIVDAEDYFRHVHAAMLDARERIFLIGWDFDARIRLVHDDDGPGPGKVGPFLDWLIERNPDLHIYILRWDTGALRSLFQPTTLATILRWWRHPRVHVKLDSVHPPAASHHQKIVVIDDCTAFCGGIDMTKDRWDTRAHRDDDPGRVAPNGDGYGPWHDATTALSGPIAAALGDLARDRWHRADGERIEPCRARETIWPDGLPVQFRDVRVAVSRTYPEMTNQPLIAEIEQLYVDLIGRAERWIYAESQYFASRAVAEAIAKRLEERDGPEIVIINPVKAEGWLEPLAMDTARARLVHTLSVLDRDDRFRMFHPLTPLATPIYVHAKVMVIDNRIIRVGSSNFNNRSLRLDTECDVTIEAENDETAATIAAIRNDLIAEHCGCTADAVAETLEGERSLIATIESLSSDGKRLRRYRIPDLSEVETWLADNEILDPEGPDAMFEPLSKRGLVRRMVGRLMPSPR